MQPQRKTGYIRYVLLLNTPNTLLVVFKIWLFADMLCPMFPRAKHENEINHKRVVLDTIHIVINKSQQSLLLSHATNKPS